MSDLTDFLLARLADDEERAIFVQTQIEGARWRPFEQWRLSWQDEYDLLCIEPSRALAEVEAKRRLIDWAAPVAGSVYVETDRPGVYDKHPVRRMSEDGEDVLLCLALPYADHPDYRPEWQL